MQENKSVGNNKRVRIKYSAINPISIQFQEIPIAKEELFVIPLFTLCETHVFIDEKDESKIEQ